MGGISRDQAFELDRGDELAPFAERFVVDDPDLLYMDGNSLGRLSIPVRDRLARVIQDEWGGGLIRSWHGWIELSTRVGDLLASSLLGAGPGEVVLADSTSVNYYRLAHAAVRARPGRAVLVTDADNFPTNRYVLEGLADALGLEVRFLESADPIAGPDAGAVAAVVDGRTALVTFSHVAYRSGALADMAAITAVAHDAGALALWDLSHSVGSFPVDLAGSGADLAVGCTYKYLNAGPGAPAFLYVRRELQEVLTQPIWGWFGQRGQFEMGPRYEPAEGIARYLVGTTPVLGAAAVEEAVGLVAEAGIERLRAKGKVLTEMVADLADDWLAPLGFAVASPRDPERRGSHVSLAHPDGFQIARALAEVSKVVTDFRRPDVIRMTPAPLYTSFAQAWDAMDRLRDLVQTEAYRSVDPTPGRVT